MPKTAAVTGVEKSMTKKSVVDVRSGDTIRVHEQITEGSKQRVQVFEGTVIRVRNQSSLTYSVLVRKVASGVGVEKSFMMHAPSVIKVEIVKRSKVRRNYLTYMRERSGKSARLAAVDFDSDKVNSIEEQVAAEDPVPPAEPEAETTENTTEEKPAEQDTADAKDQAEKTEEPDAKASDDKPEKATESKA